MQLNGHVSTISAPLRARRPFSCIWHLLLATSVIVCAAAVESSLAAQAIHITPDVDTAVVLANTTGLTRSFKVLNDSTVSVVVRLTCLPGGNVNTCTNVPTSVTVPSRQSVFVTPHFNSAAVGTGSVTIKGTAGKFTVEGKATIIVAAPVVAIAPDTLDVSASANDSSLSYPFVVANAGGIGATISLSVSSCTAPAANCSLGAVTQVNVAAHASTIVTVSYGTGAPGTGGWIKLHGAAGTSQDDGSLRVAAVDAPPVLGRAVAGPGIERDLCLTIAAGPDGAIECGDLRLAHKLPPTITKNKRRVPLLVYNSAAAHPYPLIPAVVTLAAPVDDVQATLYVNNVQRGGTQSWSGSDWGSGSTRRLVVGFDALNDSTGMYPYRLELRAITDSVSDVIRIDTGHVAILNLSQSQIAPGWAIDGIGRLLREADNPNNIVLEDGDGSMRTYRPVAGRLSSDSMWAAPQLERRDWLTRAVVGAGAYYVQHAAHDATIWYDVNTGLEMMAVNRLGDTTYVGWNATCRTPATIRLPAPAAAGTSSYVFTYASGSGCTSLTGVTQNAPSTSDTARSVSLSWDDAHTLRVQNPDGYPVRYVYDSSFGNRVAERVDQLGRITSYAYDSGAKVSQVTIQMGTGVAPITIGFSSAETRGLQGSRALDTTLAYARLDGARHVGDSTLYWVDTHGAPQKIQNAFGNITTIVRDTTWPALAASVVSPNAFVTTATYDDFGHVGSVTSVHPFSDTRSPVTHFVWDPKWDEVTKVVLPDSETTWFDYDPLTGNRLWQQQARTIDDMSRRISFAYASHAGGMNGAALQLLSSVRAPNTVGKDSLEYDALGNLSAQQTPLGFRTEIVHDAFGRDSVVRTQIDTLEPATLWQSDTALYDAMDRTIRTVVDGPAIATSGSGDEALIVVSAYDSAGELKELDRTSRPDSTSGPIGTIARRYRYDAAGRMIALEETSAPRADSVKVDSTVYDPAGNITTTISRRVDVPTQHRVRIQMAYDKLNRLTDRWLDTVSYALRDTGLADKTNFEFEDTAFLPAAGRNQINAAGRQRPYPLYPNDGSTGYRIPGDHESFSYDPEIGLLIRAANSAAVVERTLFPNGAIETETQKIATLSGDTSVHAYTLAYAYDDNGRVKSLQYPAQLMPLGSEAAGYTYDPTTGALRTATDIIGDQFTYGYNNRGEPDTLIAGSAYGRIRHFDDDGRLVGDTLRYCATGPCANPLSASQVWREATIHYDARDKATSSESPLPWNEVRTAAYTGLGQLANYSGSWTAITFQGLPASYSIADTLRYDAMGNVTYSATSSNGTAEFQESDGALDEFDHWHLGFSDPSYEPGTGRYVGAIADGGDQTIDYDEAGNAIFLSNVSESGNSWDRASYYDAAGRVRANDSRSMGNSNDRTGHPLKSVFEEYRYDALGRRVFVRTRSWCDAAIIGTGPEVSGICRTSTVRRTIWNGTRELMEIQMPDDSTGRENDVGPIVRDFDASVSSSDESQWYPTDPNKQFGRVAYLQGLDVDEPLSTVRMRYRDRSLSTTDSSYEFPTFAVLPLWTWQGTLEGNLFAGGTGDSSLTGRALDCVVASTGQRCSAPPCDYVNDRCVAAPAISAFFPEDRPMVLAIGWQGTLLTDKQDAAGTLYRRNRNYDPATGRFTQEDPEGLAGGMNLYGFADGDPVNFQDPFGLKSCAELQGDLEKAYRDFKKYYDKQQDFVRKGRFNVGHQEQLEKLQNQVKNKLEAYRAGDDDGNRCDDDDDPRHQAFAKFQTIVNWSTAPLPEAQRLRSEVFAPEDVTVVQPLIPPPNAVSSRKAAAAAGAATAAVIAYWIISEGSRAFLPRNFVPWP